jgi:hypothetical protein
MNKLKTCLIIALLALTMALYTSKKTAADVCTTVTINPSQVDSWMYWASGSGNGTIYEFSVNVIISNVTDLAGWQFGLYWNNSYLNCDSVTIQNPSTWTETVNVNVSNGIDNSYNSTNGYFGYATGAAQPCPDFTGTLTIATLTFHQLVNVSATTPLNIDAVNTEFMDGNINDIAFSSTDGSVVMNTGKAPTTVTICGNGSTIQLVTWPSNWTNWQCAQSNDGDTSYVRTGSRGCAGESDYDLYNASCPWIPSGAANVTVSVHVVVRSTSASYEASFSSIINAASTGYDQGGTFVPSTTYQDYNCNFSISASDGASLQIGVYINPGTHLILGTLNYYDGYCTQVYAIITWS